MLVYVCWFTYANSLDLDIANKYKFAVLRLLYYVCCFTYANSLDFGIAGKFTFAGLRLLVYVLSRDEHGNGGGNGGGPTYRYANTDRF